VEKSDYIKKISIWIFIIPVLAINLCLFISVNYYLLDDTIFELSEIGKIGFTIPYIDGGVSISRTARNFPTYLIFKPAMIITSIVLIKYWVANNNLIKSINKASENKKFLTFGVLSAVFLILHSIFLGVHFDNDLYKLFRRFILLAFILFEIIAQGLLVITLFKIKEKIINIINNKVLYLKMALVTLLAIVAIASIPIVSSPGNTQFKHALEWNYFIGVILFYLLTFFFWRKSQKNQKF